MKLPLSLHRLWAIVAKEFIQLRRDRITFAMMVGIPVMQLVLFGFAINTDPKHLPTVVLDADQRLLLFSRGAEQAFRTESAEVVGRPRPVAAELRAALAPRAREAAR